MEKGKGLYLAFFFLLDSKGVVLQQKQRCQYSYQRHHLRTHFELILFAHKTNSRFSREKRRMKLHVIEDLINARGNDLVPRILGYGLEIKHIGNEAEFSNRGLGFVPVEKTNKNKRSKLIS